MANVRHLQGVKIGIRATRQQDVCGLTLPRHKEASRWTHGERSAMRMRQQDLPNKSGRVIIRSELRIETGFPQMSCRRREEIGSTTGELAVPQELKDMLIPPDSDPRKSRPMKAATAGASSGSSQMEDSRAVAGTPTQQNSTTDESRMDVERGETETNPEVRRHRTPDDE